MQFVNRYSNVFNKIQYFERQLLVLREKVNIILQKITVLKSENEKLQLDIKLLEEENKRLSNLVKDYMQLQTKTEIAKNKLRYLINKISENV